MRLKFKLLFGIFGLLWCSWAWGQTNVREADLCDIAAHPANYNGELVRVRGTLESTMETYVIAKDECAAIPLEYPPSLTPKTGFALQRNAALKKLEKMQRANSKQMQCLGLCPKGPFYDPITATVIGRVDAVPESYVKGPPLQRQGFGDKRASMVRIVVQSYAEVEGRVRPNSPGPASQPGASASGPEGTLLHESGHVDPPKPQ